MHVELLITGSTIAILSAALFYVLRCMVARDLSKIVKY